VEKGKKLYRKIDNKWVTIKGFFYLHDDLTQSLVYPEPVVTLYSNVDSKQIKLSHVLFEDNTFDYVHNLYTHLYMTEPEYEKSRQAQIEKFQEADGLWSAYQIARHFPTTEHIEEEYTQDDYDGQHAEEKVLWYESDLVPNPSQNSKRFKLFK